MSGETPWLRVPRALRAGGYDQILLHMENFSTPHPTLVPRLANLATVAVVVAATWWSSAQRPVDVPAEAALGTPAPQLIVPVQQAPAAAPSTGTTQANWPSKTTALPRDGLQAVGFQTATRR